MSCLLYQDSLNISVFLSVCLESTRSLFLDVQSYTAALVSGMELDHGDVFSEEDEDDDKSAEEVNDNDSDVTVPCSPQNPEEII